MSHSLSKESHGAVGKVAKVTFAFWIIKIVATTLGETGGDALSMPPIELGYLVSTAIFLAFFAITVTAQVAVKKYYPALYWAVIIATTTLGTTTADWLTRDLKFFGSEGPFYGATALVLFLSLIAVLVGWRLASGSISIKDIKSTKSEVFYWLAIVVSNTLGTALGDWVADSDKIGFGGGAGIFGVALVVIAGLYFATKLSRPILFWAAFILTRPFGATLGDLITKPRADGGMDISRPVASLIILVLMIPLVYFFSRSAEDSTSPAEAA